MAEKKKLDLHTKPKQPIQLNRPLIISAVIIITTVLALAIVSAFNTGKSKPKEETDKTKIIADKTADISPELRGLPSSYSDIDAIRKFIPEQDNMELSLLLRQLRNLESEYEIMKRQLASRGDQQPTKTFDDPQTQQAKKSDLVFGGLGSGMENMVGSSARGSKTGLTKDDDLVATEAQEEFFKQKSSNDQKLAVMKGKDRPDEIYDLHNVIKPASKFQVMAGTAIPATLITGINTSVPGTVIAQVTNNVYDTVTGKYLLIPKGSKILGEYSSRVTPGQERVLMAFTRLVRPDGSSILLGKPFGADMHGVSGAEGNVDNHWAQVLGAATISTILSFGAGMASDSFNTGNNNYPNSKQSGISTAGSNVSKVGEMISGRAMRIPPTITLPAGYRFNVSVKRDMVLTPFKPRA